MKNGLMGFAALSAVLLLGGVSVARADSAEANCEVRKEGETRKGASGPCTFSQRQGYITLSLRNGDSYDLSPGGQPNVYKDQKGKKVVRTINGSTEEFKFEGGKKIIMTYAGAATAAPVAAAAVPAGQPDAFGTVCAVIVDGKTYRYRCKATDYYTGGKKTTTVLAYPDQNIELTWKPGNRVSVLFEGMNPQEAKYATSEGETNFVFEGKTYYYYSDKSLAQIELQHFKE